MALKTRRLLFLLLSIALAACQPAPTPTATPVPSPSPLPAVVHPTSTLPEDKEATVTPVPTPTEIPADWQGFSSQSFNLSLRYPATWQAQDEFSASGPDGFWQVELRPYAQSLYDQLGSLCVQQSNDPASSARYGATPFIYDWQHWDAAQNAWSGYGCITAPESPQPGLESVLFARIPGHPAELLILRADAPHFGGILSSLRFLQVTPEPPSNGYYDSPHCQEKPSVPEVSTLHTMGFTITEYALAYDSCHPIAHFDGFRARVRALGLGTDMLWKQSQLEVMRAVNRTLDSFGLRLKDNPTTQPWVSFSLMQGQETLFVNLVSLGQISTNPDQTDFIFWAQAEDEHGSRFPILVTAQGAQAFPSWSEGLNSVWAGQQQVAYEYSRKHTFLVGAPAQIEISSNGLPLQNISIPQSNAAGSPVRGLWAWDGHWVMEIRSTLFVDGQPKNHAWGYAEIFDWHLVNGQPLFAARRANDFTLVYHGQELPVAYDDIAHGDVCCETGIYRFQPLADGALFYARRNGLWFLVRVQTDLE